MEQMKTILTIAASDTSAGAGIQQDLKTISAHGHYALTAITALTAQSTQGVSGVMPVPADHLRHELATLLADIRPQAIKIGIIPSLAAARVVEEVVRELSVPTVLDPVLRSTSGWPFIDDECITYVKDCLVPLCTLVTPNLPEQEALRLAPTVPTLLKGGHGQGDTLTDTLLLPNGERHTYTAPRLATRNLHGTGCTLSSAIACRLAEGHPLPEACRLAHEFTQQAIARAQHLRIGQGNGPLWVFE